LSEIFVIGATPPSFDKALWYWPCIFKVEDVSTAPEALEIPSAR